MHLYIMRHGEAKLEGEDPERGLTDRGKAIVRRVAEQLRKKGAQPVKILHSPKKRARETAEIVADELKPIEGISETNGLRPSDSPGIWEASITGTDEDIMLVGHLPHVGDLTALLTGANAPSFEAAMVVCLKGVKGGFKREYSISPGDLD